MNNRWISLDQAETAMKLQEVILRAAAGELKWYEAAEIIGISPRSMRRWKKRYEEFGYDGLIDTRTTTPPANKIPFEIVTKVLTLYQQEFEGFNVKHFHDEITREHDDIRVSYTWTKDLLQHAGLVDKTKVRGTYRRRRPRKPCTGMMLHLDGSQHRWFRHPHVSRQCLLVLLDDATSEILAAQFVPEETTVACLEVIRDVVVRHGTFAALYTDRASHFVYTPSAGGKPDRSSPTQIEQILDELGIELIVAYSPEARGRSERMFGTLQGRLPQELHRAEITTYEEANRYLGQVYLPKHNAKFTVNPTQDLTAFLPVSEADISRVFARRYTRVVRRDNTIEFKGTSYQLPRMRGAATLSGRKVEVRRHLDDQIEILIGRRLIATFEAEDVWAQDSSEEAS